MFYSLRSNLFFEVILYLSKEPYRKRPFVHKIFVHIFFCAPNPPPSQNSKVMDFLLNFY